MDFSTNSWYQYVLNVGQVGALTDFPTLGLDDNGLYVAAIQLTNLSSTYSGNVIVAVKKPEVFNGVLITNRIDVYITNSLPAPGATIQPAVNFDFVPASGYAWFVTKGAPQFGTNYQGGAILYAGLQWSGTNASLTTSWVVVTNTGPNYRDYYDLDITNVQAPEAASSGGQYLNLWPIGSRLATPMIRSGSLWLCQAVGLSGASAVYTNIVYAGDLSRTNVDRSGIQWLKLAVDSTNGLLSYVAHGRACDRVAATNALWYHYPSIAANCAADMAMGFSGSSATNYVSAFYYWRLADGTVIGSPGLIRAGTTNSNDPIWGDYSATSIDPVDDRGFWTVQQIARLPPGGDPDSARWETVIARLKPEQ